MHHGTLESLACIDSASKFKAARPWMGCVEMPTVEALDGGLGSGSESTVVRQKVSEERKRTDLFLIQIQDLVETRSTHETFVYVVRG